MRLHDAIACSETEEAVRTIGPCTRRGCECRVFGGDGVIQWLARGWDVVHPNAPLLWGPFECFVCRERHFTIFEVTEGYKQDQFTPDDPHRQNVCLYDAEKHDDWEPLGDRVNVLEAIARAAREPKKSTHL